MEIGFAFIYQIDDSGAIILKIEPNGEAIIPEYFLSDVSWLFLSS